MFPTATSLRIGAIPTGPTGIGTVSIRARNPRRRSDPVEHSPFRTEPNRPVPSAHAGSIELPHFDIPIPARSNPHRAYAEKQNMAWLRHHGMITSPEAEQAYAAWDVGDHSARSWPDATPDDLALGTDLLAFFFLFDDQFDTLQVRDIDQSSSVCQHLISIAHQVSTAQPNSPVTRAFEDIVHRGYQNMPVSWVSRTAGDWERYFAAYPHEQIRRHDQQTPVLDDYLTIRRGSAGTEVVADMVERLNSVQLPVITHHSPHLRLMRQIFADVPFICNDVYSYEKEQARGEVYNMVAVLMHANHYSIQDAVVEIQRLVEDQVNRFMELRDEVPQLLEDLNLPEVQQQHVTRYVTGLGDWLRGHNDWMTTTSRYHSTGTPSATTDGFAEELLE